MGATRHEREAMNTLDDLKRRRIEMAKYRIIAAVLIEFEVEAENESDAEMFAPALLDSRVLVLEGAKFRDASYAAVAVN